MRQINLNNFFKITLLFVIGLILVALVFSYIGQQRVIYAGASKEKPPIPADVQEVKIGQSYGLFLNASKSINDERPLIIYFHGNKNPAATWVNRYSTLLSHGVSTLLVEYPGYGGSPGSPNINTITKIAHAAYDFAIRRLDVNVLKIFAYGRSLGGGPAAILARDRKVAGLILESTYTSMAALASEKGLPSVLLRETYDPESILSQTNLPSLVIHGSQDQLIYKTHGRELAAASENGKLIELNCGHNCPFQINAIIDFVVAHSMPD